MQSLATTASEKPHRRRWTKKEFYQMAEMGWFEGKRAELIEGEIIEMPAMNVAHATAVRLSLAVLRDVFSKDYVVDSQLPFNLGESSEPQPDIAVIKGGLRDFIHFHPSSAVLIIEISDSTLSYDRNRKAALYARNRILDYWILNLKRRCLEVYRSPIEDKKSDYVFRYDSKVIISQNDFVSPLALPETSIKVADLLP